MKNKKAAPVISRRLCCVSNLYFYISNEIEEMPGSWLLCTLLSSAEDEQGCCQETGEGETTLRWNGAAAARR